MRKISKTLAIMGLLTPLSASALGIGDIRLRSALNQSLNAEIPLVTSGADSISDVRVTLASAEAFAKAGVERSFFLTKLRFTPVQKSDGSYAIQITSQEAIREPFLNFLIEVNWPQGKVVREFTVLVDPPSTYREKTVAVPELPATQAAPLRAEPAPQPEAIKAPSRPRRTAAPSQTFDKLETGSVYGPVQRNETLWSIAKRLNQDPAVSQEKMMAALLQANPQAFVGNDINALKAGATLQVPTAASILGTAPSRAPEKSDQQAAKEGRLTPREAEPAAPQAPQAPQGQLKLLAPSEGKPEAGGTVAATAAAETTKKELEAEVADTVKQENETIRSQLSEMEKKLASMQRMLTVKDEQIATLQAGTKAAETPTPPQSLPEAPTTPPVVATQGTEAPAQGAAEPVPATSVAEKPQLTEPAAEPPKPAPAPAPDVAVQPPKPAPQPKVTPPASKAEDKSFFANSSYLIFGAGGTLLVGVLAWLAYRRRAAMLDDFESVFSREARSSVLKLGGSPSKSSVEEKLSAEIAATPKSSFLVEFSQSDFDSLDVESDELDPISEADVYLAYGRYKQAEELIRHAIEQHPERDECKLKLLEIHYATENRDAFESYARQLHEDGKDANPDFWGKVIEMGRELCPSSALFEGVDAASLELKTPGFGVSSAPTKNAAGALELDQELLDELKQFKRTDSAVDAVPGNIPGPAVDDTKDDAADDMLLDFEPSNFRTQPSKESTPSQAPHLDLDNLIPFEISDSELEDSAQTLDDMLLDLEAKQDFASKGTAPLAAGSPKSETAGQPQSTGLSFELDDEFASLTDMDELETKLDLAKAFVDMDDMSSAREILNDVVEKGTAAQQAEAKHLLEKITH